MSIPAGPASSTVGDDYATLAELKARLGVTDTNEDTPLQSALTAASRAVEDHCGRVFTTTGTPVARVYWPTDDTCQRVDDILTLSGLVVKTDEDDDGVYETTWTLTTDYVAAPHNALTDGKPVTRLSAVGSRCFPVGTLRPTVEVTAVYGWAAVPEPVKHATLLLAARLFRRKDTPEGVAGGNDFGVVRISRWEDPDVVMRLAPLRRPDNASGWGIG